MVEVDEGEGGKVVEGIGGGWSGEEGGGVMRREEERGRKKLVERV